MSGVVDVEEVVVACVFEVAEEGCYGAGRREGVSAWLVGLMGGWVRGWTVPPPDEFSTLKFEKILFFVPAAVGHLRPAFGGDVVFGGVAEVDVES